MTLQQHDRGVCKKLLMNFWEKIFFLAKLFSLYFFRKNKILFKKNFDRVKSPPFYYRGCRLNRDSFLSPAAVGKTCRYDEQVANWAFQSHKTNPFASRAK